MKFAVRKAGVDDAHSIAQVQVESWKTTYTGIVPDAYLESLTPESRVESWKQRLEAGTPLIFVAENAAGVFGFVSGGPLREAIDGYDGELYAIYLLHGEQKRGVGRILVRTLAEVLRGNGFKSLIVWVLAENPAVGFYKSLGGSQVAEKEIEIGGARLAEIALGWTSFDDLV